MKKRIIQALCLIFIAGIIGIGVFNIKEYHFTTDTVTKPDTKLLLSKEDKDWKDFSFSLMQEAKKYDYIMAEVTVNAQGEDIQWTYGEDRDSLVTAFREKKKECMAREKKEAADYWLFLKIRSDDIHDLDIWKGVQEEWPMSPDEEFGHSAHVGDTGSVEMEDSGKWRAYIYEGFLYVIECVDNQLSSEEQVASTLWDSYMNQLLKAQSSRSRFINYTMDEEDFYWRDHSKRVIHMKNPDRVFTQVQGFDEFFYDAGEKLPCGILEKAEYTLASTKDMPGIKVTFTLDVPAEEVELSQDWLFNDCPADYPYIMEVKDSKTGEVYQECPMHLCVDFLDTVWFTDSYGLTMWISYPSHRWVDGKWYDYEEYQHLPDSEKKASIYADGYFTYEEPAAWAGYRGYTDGEPEIYVWNTEDKKFQPLQKTGNYSYEQFGYTILVQEGDTLRKLAKEYLGDEDKYMDLYMINRATIGDDPDMIIPGMLLYTE